MKDIIIRRVAIGLSISAFLTLVLRLNGMPIWSTMLFCLAACFWWVGVVYSIPYYVSKIRNHLNSILKISIVMFLAVGRNALFIILLVLYVVYIITFGWVYGLLLLYRDISRI